jgi:hypothetical protein
MLNAQTEGHDKKCGCNGCWEDCNDNPRNYDIWEDEKNPEYNQQMSDIVISKLFAMNVNRYKDIQEKNSLIDELKDQVSDLELSASYEKWHRIYYSIATEILFRNPGWYTSLSTDLNNMSAFINLCADIQVHFNEGKQLKVTQLIEEMIEHCLCWLVVREVDRTN